MLITHVQVISNGRVSDVNTLHLSYFQREGTVIINLGDFRDDYSFTHSFILLVIINQKSTAK